MSRTLQGNFRRRVKVWLANRNQSVSALAKQIGRRRDTVSTAIHTDRFPRVRAQIAKVIT